MLKRTLLILACACSCMTAAAQADLTTLCAQYEANKRDLNVAKEYAEALEQAGKGKEAEAVVREYMGRCPVLQIEDKDTYLFVNRYVFENPYSNVFDYGIYAIKKMKWDRMEEAAGDVAGDKVTRLKNLFKGWGSGVSGGDEIDKRYEVLMLLSNGLRKEINHLCAPEFQDGQYVLPSYDAAKIDHLTRLLARGDLLQEDEMAVKLAVAKAMHANEQSRVLDYLETACEWGLEDIRGNYVVGILSVLVSHNMEQDVAKRAIDIVNELVVQEEAEGGGTNYYFLLSQLYALVGDKENSVRCKQKGDAIEAERMAKFGDLFKALQEN